MGTRLIEDSQRKLNIIVEIVLDDSEDGGPSYCGHQCSFLYDPEYWILNDCRKCEKQDKVPKCRLFDKELVAERGHYTCFKRCPQCLHGNVF